MPIQLKAALVTLVVGTCLADLVVILAYHAWLLPYLCFTLSGGIFLTVIYGSAVRLLAENARKAEAAASKQKVVAS